MCKMFTQTLLKVVLALNVRTVMSNEVSENTLWLEACSAFRWCLISFRTANTHTVQWVGIAHLLI